MFKMDARKLRKIHSDKHKTIMRHEDGHEITIAHAPLTKKVRAQLEAIPVDKEALKLFQGGQIPGGAGSPYMDKEKAKAIAEDVNKPRSIQDYIKNFKEGVDIGSRKAPESKQPKEAQQPKKYADGGGPVEEPSAENSSQMPSELSQIMQAAAQQPAAAPLQIEPVSPQEVAMGSMPLQVEPVSNPNLAMGLPPQAAQTAPIEVVQPPAAAPQAQVISPDQPTQQAEMPSMGGAYAQQMNAIDDEAKAKAALGNAQARALDAQRVIEQQRMQKFEANFAALETERKHLMQDIKNNLVNPANYWKDHSKIMTGLGILIAGFNPTSSPNAAIEMVNHAMDRDLQAQAQNLNQRHNLLAANLHQFGNMKDAMQMTRMMQSDMLAHQLESLAAKSQDPLAKARAEQLKGQLQMQTLPIMQDMAFKRTLMQIGTEGAGGDQAAAHQQQDPEKLMAALRVMKPEMAKEMESRYVPHVGFASVPLPEKVRDKMVTHQQLDETARHLRDWVKKNGGTVDPKIVNEGKALAQNLQAKVREAMLNTVYREGEQPLLDKMVSGDPTAFLSNVRVMPALDALIKNNVRDFSSLRKGYGLPAVSPTENFTPAQKNDMMWAQSRLKANPNDPMAMLVLKKLGVE